jgi:gliding motility-associated-like protein
MKQNLLFLLFFIPFLVYAQHPEANRANIWYFGNGAGLDFSSGSPVAITNGALHTHEGCASMCDINGDLLMYTDGDTIWDRNHNPMPNGTMLTGCPILGSSAQAALIIPQPGHDSLYYIFTVDCAENAGLLGLRYNVVNMNLNGGLGDVIPSQKNVLLYTPCTEGLTATYNCDETGVWIMSHEYNTNNYVCYFLDNNGINLTPKISSIGGIYDYFQAYMRFSPNGEYFASTYNAVNVLFNFDNNTGQLYNLINLPNNSGEYGTCFSNDNSKLYFTSGGNYIYQFDINALDIPNSMVQIYDPSWSNADFGAIQNGIDNNMYISSVGLNYISSIMMPNATLSMPNINHLSIHLNGTTSAYGITDFIQSYFNTSPEDDCKEEQLFIPNVFSPNGDGVNDVFKIEGLQQGDQVAIYNRWGVKIYEFTNINDTWDGRTTAGEKCSTGVYYYYVKLKNAENKKGFIHLFY